MTNDVEEFSINKNRLSKSTAEKVSEKGLPKLINIYSKYDIEATFYFTGTFASSFPKSVKLVHDNGHEIGSHGHSHHLHHSFDIMSTNQQYVHLTKSKRVIEELVGPIEAFRAPALRISNNTIPILERLGFKTDSSVSSQRFDGPFTFGSGRKIKWLVAPRKPYFPSHKNPYKRGRSNILEIPVSAFGLSYQGTTMRIAPKLNELLGNYLHFESNKTGKPIVFLFHPNELINEPDAKPTRRSNSIVKSFFAEYLRTRMKKSNLGNKSLQLLEEVIKSSMDYGSSFVSAKSYRNLHEKIYV